MSTQLAAEFERTRPRLRAVAYRVLGSAADAEDAVQEAWVRLSRADPNQVVNLQAWLTTVVSRIALDMLRVRKARREARLDELRVAAWPEAPDATSPEQEVEMAESIGIALAVVLETLSPTERVALVLHDVFGVPFAEIGRILDRSADAAKMAASRARGRIHRASPPVTDLVNQREVVEAFRTAARQGDVGSLMAILHPDVEVVADTDALSPGAPLITRGAAAVARQALSYQPMAQFAHPVLVDGRPGFLVRPDGSTPIALLMFTVRDGLVTRLDVVADADRLAAVDWPI